MIGTVALSRQGRRAADDGLVDEERRLDPPVDPRDEHLLGPADAPRTIVLFADYECPSTRAVGRELEAVRERAGDDVRVVVRHLPNEDVHPGATLAAEAVVAAAAQGRFAEMHARLVAHPDGDDLGPADLLAIADELGLDPDRIADDLRHHVRLPAVESDVDSAVRSGVDHTPALFLDGAPLDGPHDADSLLARLSEAGPR